MLPAYHSSRGVLPIVVCVCVCVCVCDRESSIIRRPWPTGGLLRQGKKDPYSMLRRILGSERLEAVGIAK